MEIIEALIFRNDLRAISPLKIHDNNFLHLSGEGYYHEKTERDTIIILGEKKSYEFQNIMNVIDEKTKKLVDEFLDKDCLEMDEVSIVINENCINNILLSYDYVNEFCEYFEDEYAIYYDEEKSKITGYVFLSSNDAYLFEEIQKFQEDFAKEKGLEDDFIDNIMDYDVEIEELEMKVREYIEEKF